MKIKSKPHRILRSLHLQAALCAAFLTLAAHAADIPNTAPNGKPWNVLMIALDDLNDYPSILADYPGVKTPHLDKLAESSLCFSSASCPATACQPSRSAILSGMAPWRTGIYANDGKWNKTPALKGIRPLPQVFRESGWYTMTNGKIFHETNRTMKRQCELMWDDQGDRGGYAPKANPNPLESLGISSVRSFGVVEESTIKDFQTVVCTEEMLAKDYEKPFFLAHGIRYPHVPLTVSQRFLDLYPEEDMAFPPPGYREDDLDDVPSASTQGQFTMDWFRKLKDAGLWKTYLRHYLACISAADELVGRVITALDNSPHKDNTIVVVWADHGWHVGEKSRIAKYTLWERTAHVTFLIRVPGITTTGTSCDRVVSLQDIYPTLVDLCGLDDPGHELSGRSIAPLLAEPDREWPYPAIISNGPDKHGIRNEQFRYITYGGDQEELYDLDKDPHEFTNLAANPEYTPVKAELAAEIMWAMAVLAVAAGPCQSPTVPQPAQSAPRPNIIFILADDLGYSNLGCYGVEKWETALGEMPTRTTNLDRLANEGIRFEYAYASPACSPTRGQIMTGKYVHRIGLHDIVGRRGAVDELDLDTHGTVAQGLRNAGYDTVMVGKWHLAKGKLGINDEPLRQTQDTDDPHVAKAGFNRQFHTVGPHLREYGDPTKEGDYKYYPDVLQDYILAYLDSRKGQEQPFFMYYASPVPHIPHRPTPLNPDGKQGTQSGGDKRNLPHILEYFDQQIGDIAAKLEELGLRKNTLIIFAGDNGGGLSGIRADGTRVPGSGKGNVGEGSRVPLVMNWPASIPPGTVYQGVVDMTDIMPTLLELAGTPIPGDVDGVSLARPMSGDPTRVREWAHCLTLSRYFFRDEQYALREDGLLYDVRPETLHGEGFKTAMNGVLIPDDELTEEQRAATARLEAARDKILPEGWPPSELKPILATAREKALGRREPKEDSE